MKRLRVGVIYGGRSGEHEVSLASAAAVFANLDRQRYEPIAIRIEKDGRWVLSDRPPSAASAADVISQMQADATRLRGGKEVFLPPRPGEETLLVVDRRRNEQDEVEILSLASVKLDVVFPVLHGPYGEDGTIQGLLELAGVPFVGCGVLASAVSMDKAVSKVLFAALGLRVSPWLAVPRRAWVAGPTAVRDQIEAALPYPLFVKPANLGSSVGISKVHDRSRIRRRAMRTAAEFDRKIVVEMAVPHARELECAVLGNDTPEASRPGEIVPANEFYDYDAKYVSGRSRSIIPADISEALAESVRRQAVTAFLAVEGSGWRAWISC